MKTILREYANKLAKKGLLNKKKLLSFVNTYLKGVKPSQLDTALAQLPANVIEQNIDEINHVKNLITLRNIEKKYGPTETYSLIRTTSPVYLKDVNQYYDEVSNEPNFKKYYEQEKGYIDKTIGIQKEKLQKQTGFRLQDIALQQDYQKKQWENFQNQIKQYTQYAKQDYIEKLKGTNQQLDQALQQATEVYGMRNLLNSGYYKQYANRAMGEGEDQQNKLEESYNRQVLDYQNKLKEAKQRFDYTLNKLNLNKQQTQELANLGEQQLDNTYNRNLLQLNRDKFLTATQIAGQKYSEELNKRRQQAMDVMKNISKQRNGF